MKLKLIQVGVGGHGRFVGGHFVAKSPDFVYAGLVDISPQSLEEFAQEHGISESLQYTDYRQAFQELDADAVLIEAASPVHYDVCKAALENDLHVLVEKPFTLTMEEAEELVRLAAEKNKNIMVNQNYRFFSTVLTLKKAMQDESLGKLSFINAQFFCDHNGKGYQRVMDNYILLEMSVHHVDMIRFLLDSDIVSVRGKTWNDPDSGYKGDPHVNAVYETESGVPVFYISSLLAKGVPMPWEGVWRIQYENGALYMDDLGEGYGVYKVGADRVKTKLPLFVPERESIHGSLAEFARSILENREPSTSGRDNLQTLAALLATSQSSREGVEVKLPRSVKI
jgi:predicted dehydrogenase